jgi:hypothetical protein
MRSNGSRCFSPNGTRGSAAMATGGSPDRPIAWDSSVSPEPVSPPDPTGPGPGSRMPAVKNVGEPSGKPLARIDATAGGNQRQSGSHSRAAWAPPADPTQRRDRQRLDRLQADRLELAHDRNLLSRSTPANNRGQAPRGKERGAGYGGRPPEATDHRSPHRSLALSARAPPGRAATSSTACWSACSSDSATRPPAAGYATRSAACHQPRASSAPAR